MTGLKLLSNATNPNHKQYLLQCFANADEVWIATAFLKNSGLELLIPAIRKHVTASKPIKIITGQNFGLTEPQALRVLHDLFIDKIAANLYLDRAEEKQVVFHPKLFAFRTANTGIIVCGSANITNGGLIGNEEFSVSSETDTSSPEWREVITYFTKITDTKKADLVSLLVINRYEQFYNEQKKVRTKQKSAPDKKASVYTFDYTKLKERLKDYRNNDYRQILKERINDYIKARHLLDEIADSSRMSQRRFEDIIDTLVGKAGVSGLWRSGSLLRLRHEVYRCKTEFRTLVKCIKDNQQQPASKVFSNAKILVSDIDGARINYVAEMMMTYQPDRFANLNSNPINVLKKEAGVYFKSHSNSFNGEDYAEYCNVVLEICKQLKLKNMLEADSFFNNIYWKLKKDGRLR